MRSTSCLLALATALLIPACGGGGGSDSAVPAPQPNFTLQDANPNSATSGMNVSSAGFVGFVPAFYFGHAD